MAKSPPIYKRAGYLIRRCQQISNSIFLEETDKENMTPIQYAALRHLIDHPGIDQITLAGHIAVDRSTIGNVVQRLESRKLLRRTTGTADQRTKQLYLTRKGRDRVLRMEAGVSRTQKRLLEPLDTDQRAQFLEMLTTIANANNQYSRVPERPSTKSSPPGKNRKQ